MPITEGPWVVYPVSCNSYSCDIVRADDPNDRVAITCPNGEVELANAHAIAAVPDMIAALEAIATDQALVNDGNTKARHLALAALNKARGNA